MYSILNDLNKLILESLEEKKITGAHILDTEGAFHNVTTDSHRTSKKKRCTTKGLRIYNEKFREKDNNIFSGREFH